MANVLPQKSRKRFEREYALRVVVVGLFFLFLSISFGAILLLPSYFVSISKQEITEQQSELLQKAIERRGENTSVASLVAVKQKVDALTAIQQTVPNTEIINAVVKSTDPAVTVDAFYYTKQDGAGEVRITGRAQSRSALIAFADRLEKEEMFTDAKLPVSSLARDTNIVFSITLTGNF